MEKEANPLIGEQWSAVTPNEAKENTSSLTDLSADFSFFHSLAE